MIGERGGVKRGGVKRGGVKRGGVESRGAGGMPHTPEKFFIIRCIRLLLRPFLDQNLLLSLSL